MVTNPIKVAVICAIPWLEPPVVRVEGPGAVIGRGINLSLASSKVFVLGRLDNLDILVISSLISCGMLGGSSECMCQTPSPQRPGQSEEQQLIRNLILG